MKIKKTLLEIIHAVRELQRTNQLSGPTLGSQQPRSDMQVAGAQHLLSTAITPTIHFGVVADYIPHIRAYRVMPEGGSPLILCTAMLRGNPMPLGVVDCDSYQAGTHVWFIRHPAAVTGVILGAMPLLFTDNRRGRSDWIVPGSRSGILVDQAYKTPFTLGGQQTGGGLRNWSSRAPMDDVTGSFTRSTETGLLLHLDSYMFQARVDETCGLYLFYWDQLCRLAGYNYQHWTACTEHEALDDEGEHAWYHGLAVYPWEQQGRFRQPGKYTRENSAETVQKRQQDESYLEPQYPDIQPFHRTQIYRGYLGQGYKETQLAAPKEGDTQRFTVPERLTGLAEQNVFLDGQILFRTARGLTLAKRPLIPVPKRRLLPPDPTGDTPANYKASGKLGSGKEHMVASTLPVSEQHPGLTKAATVLDLQTYAANWKALHPFHYHAKDFSVPEERQLDLVPVQAVPQYDELKQKHYMDPPKPIEVTVDHRHKAQIYPNNSYVEMLDDGGLVFGDGFGSQIKMTGGNLYISCPGDIFMESGRSIVQWAGRDIIQRAKKSIDLTATDGDCRVKAEKNLQILGGNGGGNHGVLIESRGDGTDFDFSTPGEATAATGLIFKSKSSPIVMHGHDIYIRSTTGDVVLDANKGESNCVIHAGTATRFLSQAAIDYFGSQNEINKANVWGPGIALVDGAMHVNGRSTVSEGQLVRGGVFIVSGHINTDAGNEKVGQLQNASVIEQAIRDRESALQQAEQQGANDFDSRLKTAWYDDQRAGNADVIENAQCSLRVLSDYKTDDFVLFENQWAQLARVGGSVPDKWTEKPVKFRGQDTYPYPGKEKLTGSTYFTVEQQLYDVAQGVAKDRGDIYENPKPPVPKGTKLDGNYPIVG
jgi:hypothetical protein